MKKKRNDDFSANVNTTPTTEKPACASPQWIGPVHPPSHSTTATPDSANIAAYSPRKKRPHRMPEYSVRKPATSSDSHSGRSKGARFRLARDRKSTRLNSSHSQISYAVICLKKKTTDHGDLALILDAHRRYLES